MLKLKKWMRLIAILLGVASASWLLTGAAAPPGGGVPAGKVFYTWHTAMRESGWKDLGFWSMNADGSGKQLLPATPGLSDYTQLSHLFHQGHQWFLEARLSPLPGNGWALFAVRDDDDPAYSVYLTDVLGDCRWAKDDSFISIAAIPYITYPNGSSSYDPNALDRIYAAEITFDPNTGLPALTTPFVVVAEGEQLGYPDIFSHDWSPAGDEVVYELRPNPGPTSSKIADLVTGTTRLLAANGSSPFWSPNGTRIAYKLFNDGIYVSNPDGSARLKITNNGNDDTAGWSPDSKYVLFSRVSWHSIKGGGTEFLCDVLRVPATGGTAVNLTKNIDGYAVANDWR